MIHHDAIDPGAQRGLPTEVVQPAKHAQEDFLREVEGFLRLPQQLKRQLVHHALVIGHKPRAGCLVSRGTLLHKRPVGACRIGPREGSDRLQRDDLSAMVAPAVGPN